MAVTEVSPFQVTFASAPDANRTKDIEQPADVNENGTVGVGVEQGAPPARKQLSCWRVVVGSLMYIIWITWWSFITIDWQRVRHIFQTDILEESFKIVDSSLVKEQEVLQTSAVFLFSAGLVANFLSGAPRDAAGLRAVAAWVNSAEYKHTTPSSTQTTASQVWQYGAYEAINFRGLWGACMLFTLLSVICSYVSRSALFMCYNITKVGIEHARRKAKKQARSSSSTTQGAAQQGATGTVTPVDEAEEVGAILKARYLPIYEELGGTVRFLAQTIAASKIFFNVSLMLWLVTILYAIVVLHNLQPRQLRHYFYHNTQRSGSGLALAGIAGIITAAAGLTMCRWMLSCHKAYTLWRRDATHAAFMASLFDGSGKQSCLKWFGLGLVPEPRCMAMPPAAGADVMAIAQACRTSSSNPFDGDGRFAEGVCETLRIKTSSDVAARQRADQQLCSDEHHASASNNTPAPPASHY